MSFLVRIMKKSGKKATALCCDMCGGRSRFFAGDDHDIEPDGWSSIHEWVRTPTGRIKKRGSMVKKDYCRKCAKKLGPIDKDVVR